MAGVDLTVAAGECFGLLGPNGAGKTTTIEILEGLTPPDAGDVLVLGLRWHDGDGGRALRERLGIQLQETQLAEKLTVAETLRLFRSFYRDGHTVDDVLALVSLEEKRDSWVSKLSGGQKQRLAVACALVSRPELLFLDEPTASLDPAATKAIEDIIHAVAASGIKIVMSTHDLGEAITLADRVVVMTRRPGRIKMIHDVKLPRPRDPIKLREAPEYAREYREIWHVLGEEFRS